MSREIKFRAWDEIPGVGYRMQKWDNIKSNSIQYLWDDQTFKDRVIMQYTGLKDRDAEEIYDCDVIEITDSFGHTYNMPVLFDEGCFVLDKEGEWGCLNEWNTSCRVVGNIYENPDLLKSE